MFIVMYKYLRILSAIISVSEHRDSNKLCEERKNKNLTHSLYRNGRTLKLLYSFRRKMARDTSKDEILVKKI